MKRAEGYRVCGNIPRIRRAGAHWRVALCHAVLTPS